MTVPPLLIALPWCAALVLLLYRHLTRGPRLEAYPPRRDGPALSVVIPARNEAVNIAACVRSILGAAYAPLEVIVVDDRSSDETAAIVERLAAEPGARGRLRLVRGSEPPPGWFGKQWALWQGYGTARGDLLLFADADTRHTTELIPRAVQVVGVEQVDLVSVLPRQEMGSFWERLLQPQVFFALETRVSSLHRVNRTRRVWDAIANGQFILTPRAAYEAVGTHAAVRHTVVEDLMLAQTYVRAGRDIFLLHGAGFMTTRMYRSLGEIIEGWSKNLALGTPFMLPPVKLLRRLAPWLMWVPALAWVVPPLAWLVAGWGWARLATVVSLLLWLEVCREAGAPLGYAALYPLGAAMVAFIMLRSAWRGGRKVVWRGRTYSAD